MGGEEVVVVVRVGRTHWGSSLLHSLLDWVGRISGGPVAHLKPSPRASLLIKELKQIMWSGRRNERKKIKLQSSVAAQIMHIMFYGVPKRIQHLCFTGAVIAYESPDLEEAFFLAQAGRGKKYSKKKRMRDSRRDLGGIHECLACNWCAL